MLLCKRCRAPIARHIIKGLFVCPECNSLLDSAIDIIIVGKHHLATDRELRRESLTTERKKKNAILKKQRRLERQRGTKK